MIKAHELRVGNWVNAPNFLVYDVISTAEMNDLSYYRIIEVSENYGNNQLYEPIGLTPKILEKCGLNNVWIKESWMIVEDRSDLELFGYAMKVRNASHTKEIEFAYFKYLHQLQNLYFALTGEELIINL